MKRTEKALICFIAVFTVISVFLFTALTFISTKDKLISMRENVQLQKSQIQTNLQRRNDLIPNLVATVKGYASHEEAIFTAIADARAKLAVSIETGNIEDINKADKALNSALSSLNNLLAISEDYPTLQASEQFIALQDELAGTENQIAVSRQYYNEAVWAYNTAIQQFFTSFVARKCGYQPLPYFEADGSVMEVPYVNFD